MSFRGRILASVVMKTPPDETDGHIYAVEAELYLSHDRSGREDRFCYLERSGGEELTVLMGSSPEDILRLLLARSPRECPAQGYLARTLFSQAGLELDEGRLAAFERAFDAISDEGDQRTLRELRRRIDGEA